MTITDYPPELAALADDFLQHYFVFYPTTASDLGLHEYDGRIADFSAEAIASFVQELRSYQQRLAAIDTSSFERLAAFDYGLLRWQVEAELWRWTEECEHRRNPMIYSYDAMVDGYVKRNYAPLSVRVEALTRHLSLIPSAMQVAQQNLEQSIPRILLEESVSIFAGLIAFLEENLPQAVGHLENPAQEKALWNARDAAVKALVDFHAYMCDTLLPAAHDKFAIGAEQFAAMLRYNELIDLPLDQLLAIGEDDLIRNKSALEALAEQLDPAKTVREQILDLGRNHPGPDRLVEETRALLDGLRSFLCEHDLITLPLDSHCHVEETPPFARWAFAMMETAGPFEQIATDSFYYVTPPDADWSPEQIEGWMTKFDYATLTDVSIHEAYPGHFIHFSTVRQAPSQLVKVFASYSHYESWAHYVEQMMLEQGYGNNDPYLRMAQLAEALVRNCRYVCAIKMHTQGMTIEEASQFFMEHAHMDEVTARKEARRGAHDPGYINYTLGKLLLLKLLDEYKAAYGPNFSLKQFHNEYIGYGSPPIPLLRKLLLPQDNGVLV